MIDVKDAKNQIQVGTATLTSKNLLLRDCLGFALAENVYSPIDFPQFEQSAMDGYGIFFEDHQPNDFFVLTGEEQAGNTVIRNKVSKGECIRIFTGAKIPEGVNTVVQQEWVVKEKNGIRIQHPVKYGQNIRSVGSQTRKGQLVLPHGSSLSAAAIGLLAGLGIHTLNVVMKPRIVIINTGKELVQPGNQILSGQIYESNSFALNQALMQMHIQPVKIVQVDDNEEELAVAIQEALQCCDLLLLTGGVSVGDYDFVIPALQVNGVQQFFHKIKQKPGKPLYFGKKEEKLIFGLPGNPASVLTCFYQYVYPCIRKMTGFLQTGLPQLMLPILSNFEKKPGLTHFLKGRLHDNGVEILDHQESYKMNSFAVADVLIEIDEQVTELKINDPVKVYLLPVS
jgi:molybdopterin molybdotransferase